MDETSLHPPGGALVDRSVDGFGAATSTHRRRVPNGRAHTWRPPHGLSRRRDREILLRDGGREVDSARNSHAYPQVGFEVGDAADAKREPAHGPSVGSARATCGTPWG